MVRAAQAVAAKPLELGAKLLCRWRGSEQKPCEVIERKLKTLPDGTPDPSGEWEYCELCRSALRSLLLPPTRSKLRLSQRSLLAC
jgi:hypothetical protein